MNGKTETEEVIYYHKGGKLLWIGFHYLINLLLSIGIGVLLTIVVIMVLSFFMEFQIWILLILYILFSLFFFYWLLKVERKSKPSYKIYNDRIIFFNRRYPLEEDIIDLEEIDQVRYEDDFGKSYSSNVPSQSWIYCYFKIGYKSRSVRIRKDRIKLFIERDQERENRVIKILLFFQKKKKQVYISTRHDKIKTALNLKNWTEPGIHPSIRL